MVGVFGRINILINFGKEFRRFDGVLRELSMLCLNRKSSKILTCVAVDVLKEDSHSYIRLHGGNFLCLKFLRMETVDFAQPNEIFTTFCFVL